MKITDDERGNAHRIVGAQQENGMTKTLSLLQKGSPSRNGSVALSNKGKVGPQPEDNIRSSKVVDKVLKPITYYMCRLFDFKPPSLWDWWRNACVYVCVLQSSQPGSLGYIQPSENDGNEASKNNTLQYKVECGIQSFSLGHKPPFLFNSLRTAD